MEKLKIGFSGRPPWGETARYMCLYITGLIMTGIIPLLFGRFVSEGRLSVNEMGRLATWELLAMGAAATLSGFWFRAQHTRLIAVSATTLLLVTDLLSINAAGYWLIIIRIIAGTQGGILAQIGAAWLARTSEPARGASEFTFALGCAQLVFGAVLAGVLPRFGSTGGLMCIALTVIIAIVASLKASSPPLVVPYRLTPSVPPIPGWLSLLSTFFYLCFIFAVTTYAVPLAVEKGLTAGDGEAAVVASLVGQMAGAGGSVWLARKFNWFVVSLSLSVACLCALGVLWTTNNSAVFVAISGYLGFGPMATIAFQIPFAVEADLTRKSGNLVPAAQLLGSAAGPLVATLGVQASSVRNVIWVGGLCLLGSSLLLVAAKFLIARRAT